MERKFKNESYPGSTYINDTGVLHLPTDIYVIYMIEKVFCVGEGEEKVVCLIIIKQKSG